MPPPRFALQLLRAGKCLLLVELATGQPFQSRDPSYLLLKDMLRAAGLPDAPQIVGEPVRWPLLLRSTMDQGPESARDFVQGFVQARLEEVPSHCVWLVGLPAVRFAAAADEQAYYQMLTVEGLGEVWALPGLELLMDEPPRKALVWKAMRQLMARWKSGMSDSISFRPMTEADLDAVLKIEYAAFSHPWTRGIFQDALKSYEVWLMFDGQQQVGHGVINVIIDEAHLLNITVKPENQGRGLGLRLLQHLMARAWQLNGRECFLEVRASNQSAYRLYERYGFNEIGRRRDYYPAPGGREDALVMACTLFED